MVARMALSSDLLARALERLSALLAEARSAKSRRQFAHASRALGDAWKSVFSLERRYLQMMQPGEVVTMLANPAKVRGLAEVLAEEADLLRLQGDLQSAAATAKW